MSSFRAQEKAEKATAEESRFEDVVNGCLDGFEVCMVPEIGRGVRVTRRFERNDVLLRYFGDVVTEEEANRRKAAGPLVGHFYRYDFHLNGQKYVLDATLEDGSLGRLINHSRKHPNVRAKAFEIDGEPAIVFFAMCDLEIGTELRYDYGVRKKEDLEANPWLKK